MSGREIRTNLARTRRTVASVAAVTALLGGMLTLVAPAASAEPIAPLAPIALEDAVAGATASEARAIEDGIAVGWVMDATDSERPYAFDLRADPPAVADLAAGLGGWGFANDIDDGIVVGEFADHAFAYDLYADTPALIDLGTLGGSWSQAVAVDDGVVVGHATAADESWRAFAYDLHATTPTMIDLGTPAGSYSRASDVSGGLVVGAFADHAFAYDLRAATPALIDLGTLGGDAIRGDGIAVDGRLVTWESGDGRVLAVDLAQPDPVPFEVGTFGGYAYPADVEGGLIVGSSAYQAFAYDLGAPAPAMVSLGSGFAEAVDGTVVVGGTADTNTGFAIDVASPGWPSIELARLPGHEFASALDVDDGIAVGVSGVYAFPPIYGFHAVAWVLFQPTSIVLSASANPVTAGDELTLTATVTPPPPAGTVALLDGTTPMEGCEALVPDAGGTVTCTLTYTSLGERSLDARYTGVLWTYGPSTSALTLVVVRPTGTQLQSSANPSTVGDPVTYTATLWPILDGGAVAFTLDGVPITGCTARPVFDGVARCTVTHEAAGTYTVGADYSGSATHGASTAIPLPQHVLQPTSTDLQASPGSPSIVGATVLYTATVAPTPSGGTVMFTDDGVPIAGCNARPVSTTTGQATCSVAHGTVGEHTIDARYAGHGTFAASATPVTHVQVVRYDLRTLSPTKPIRIGGALTVRLQLRDAAGVNHLSSSIPVAVVSLSPTPTSGVVPTGSFTLVHNRKLGDSYELTVKSTRGYERGDYVLTVSVGADTYEVGFTIR